MTGTAQRWRRMVEAAPKARRHALPLRCATVLPQRIRAAEDRTVRERDHVRWSTDAVLINVPGAVIQ